MASSLPIVRQIAWISVLPQITILLLIIAIVHLLGLREPLLVGAGTYLVVSFILRLTVARHHVRGMGLIRRERFADAIPHFFNSYEFFTKHAWMDRWRAVTMLSSSRISYKEMGLLNAAFCLAQTGERERSIQEYKRVLAEFPGSKMAETALRLMESQASSA